MLTKHNVYIAKVMLFSGFGKVFLIYFTSDYVFFLLFVGVRIGFLWKIWTIFPLFFEMNCCSKDDGLLFFSFYIPKVFLSLATVAVEVSQSFAVLAMLVPLRNSFRTSLYSSSCCSLVFVLPFFRPTLPPFSR